MDATGNLGDFAGLEPFFRTIEPALDGLVDGEHFFDLHADDVVATGAPSLNRFISVITVTDRRRARTSSTIT